MNKETCGTRIRKALSIRNMKAIDLCNKTGIPKSAMSQYINDRFEPKQDRVYLIANVLKVTEAWLMGFDVPMEREPEKASSKFDNLSEPNINEQPPILKKYNELNTIGQCKTDAYVDGLLENPNYRKGEKEYSKEDGRKYTNATFDDNKEHIAALGGIKEDDDTIYTT